LLLTIDVFFYFLYSNKFVQQVFHIMKSLNNCVQEFINHHSSTLFPADNTTDTQRPRINRFHSISSAQVDIEDEDPSLLFLFSPL